MGLYFSMERRFGHLGIPGLIRILVFFKIITWVLIQARGDAGSGYYDLLAFNVPAIYQGQVWRALSFLILPGNMSFIFLLFEVIFLFMIGDGLERAWGPFGTTLYFFASAFTCVATSLLAGLIVNYPPHLPTLSNYPIYAALIMAAGFLYPDTIIQLYLVIPVKLKWIGMLAAFAVLWGVYGASSGGPAYFLGYGLPMLATLLPFLIVFVPGWIKGAKQRSEVAARRSRFEQAKLPEKEAFHQCDRCGATEVTHPDREFRINAKDQELCSACRDDAETPPSS